MNESSGKFGPTNPEVGGIIHMDHVNFETPDHEMATLFYMNGMGLTRDPYQRADEQNMGVNVGLQQFHLPRRGETTPPFHGVVGMVVPDMPGIKERCGLLAQLGKFEGTPYAWQEQGDTVLLTSPFGYRLRLHPAESILFQRPLGIAYVEIPVPVGTAEGIAKFYRQIAGAPSEFGAIGTETAAIVTSGAHQQMRFIERDLADYNTHTMHISYYTSNYNAYRETLASHGALMGLARGEVFFFDKIFDPDTGDTLITMQNEVRSVYHPDFMRPLVNRWPMVTEPFRDQTEAMKVFAANVGIAPGGR